MTGGWFIAIEGPNGVGKTTAATELGQQLSLRNLDLHLTSEPSGTPLGRLVRSTETALTGRALALAIAADRYDHVSSEITPALNSGKVVISDRYVQSSLVLQRLDGLPLSEIWRYNAFVPPPMVTFYLHHDAATIQSRLNERRHKSRLERAGSPERELELYDDAFEFLARRGWCQVKVDCRLLDPGGVAAQVLQHLDRLVT